MDIIDSLHSIDLITTLLLACLLSPLLSPIHSLSRLTKPGYAAPFVMRQKGVVSEPVKIRDMSVKPKEDSEEEEEKEKGAQKEKKHKKRRKEKDCESKESIVACIGSTETADSFNPFLQELALRLSNKTRSFTMTNE